MPSRDFPGREVTPLRDAALTAGGEAARHEVLAVVRRPSGAEPLLVEVAPLGDSAGKIGAALAGALVTLIDPENAPSFDITRFAALHGLTVAEADVCTYMVRGLTGRAIAERRRTSLQTVKSQMSSGLAKAGAARRSELIRLVVRTLPPIG